MTLGISFRNLSRKSIAELYGISFFFFLRNVYTGFHSAWTSSVKVALSHHAPQHLLLLSSYPPWMTQNANLPRIHIFLTAEDTEPVFHLRMNHPHVHLLKIACSSHLPIH